MRRIAEVEQHPLSGLYTITIYDEDAYGKEYVHGAIVLTPTEYYKIASEHGVTKDNLIIK